MDNFTFFLRLAGLWWSQSQSHSHIATDGQSVCLSWCRAPLFDTYCLVLGRDPSLTRGRVCSLSVSSIRLIVSMYNSYTFYMCHMLLNTYTIYRRPLSVCQSEVGTNLNTYIVKKKEMFRMLRLPFCRLIYK
jgi:hypothetical protein